MVPFIYIAIRSMHFVMQGTANLFVRFLLISRSSQMYVSLATPSQSFPNLSKFEVLHAATVLNKCEVLRNAGLVFCPSHLAEQRRQQGGPVEFNGPECWVFLGTSIAFCWSTIVILGGWFQFFVYLSSPIWEMIPI